ncbi:PAS domain-containing protein [uncultured Lamprocystis sp.]|uniref:PAS domain-containing protein n=1 Tax=uncultured Lamprocystis sp. TaxID=543132 RepID=UPI0025DD3E62|nr:PAS domain-containing protein [uncultured Lamprocystis sp.]
MEQGQGVFDAAQGLIAFEGFVTEVIGAINTFSDITARRQVEAELRAHERELQTLTDHSPDIIGRVDRQLRHVFVSRVITRITGKAVEEYLGKTNDELGYPPDLCALWSAHYNAVFRTGQPRELEFESRCSCATSRPARWWMSAATTS